MCDPRERIMPTDHLVSNKEPCWAMLRLQTKTPNIFMESRKNSCCRKLRNFELWWVSSWKQYTILTTTFQYKLNFIKIMWLLSFYLKKSFIWSFWRSLCHFLAREKTESKLTHRTLIFCLSWTCTVMLPLNP